MAVGCRKHDWTFGWDREGAKTRTCSKCGKVQYAYTVWR